MGMPRILPMRKPDPRFMSRLMVSVAQEFDGSGEGRARCEPTRAPLRGVGRVRRNSKITIKGSGGINIPVAVSWSNKTDLLQGNKLGGQIGISYNFSSLAGLFGGSGSN